VMADGVGFLAPRASNLTEEGRNANRRVEAVLISTE
jgi:OOP family OmpA-OmpF porin